MAFDQAAVNTLFDRVTSGALALAVFDRVNQHEPKSAPGNGLTAAVWVDAIGPAPRASGLDATSGVVTLNLRIYTSFVAPDPDQIDPNVLTATTALLGAYTGDYDLGGTVRNIDLLGQFGQPMGARAGYQSIDSKTYRIMTITLPVVINDLWIQEA